MLVDRPTCTTSKAAFKLLGPTAKQGAVKNSFTQSSESKATASKNMLSLEGPPKATTHPTTKPTEALPVIFAPRWVSSSPCTTTPLPWPSTCLSLGGVNVFATMVEGSVIWAFRMGVMFVVKLSRPTTSPPEESTSCIWHLPKERWRL